MEDESWSGVKIGYICPRCQKAGMQTFVVEGVGYDLDKARVAAWKRRTPCRSCSKPLPENLNIEIDVIATSLERLRKLGYPTPPVQ